MGVKTILRSIGVLAVTAMVLSMNGCAGAGGSEGQRKPGYANSATEIYAVGEVLGAQDAVARVPSDYARHLNSFDSPFLAQFRLGYDKGYANYRVTSNSRPPATSR